MRGDDINFASDIGVSLPELHKSLQHLGSPICFNLAVGNRLQPIPTEIINVISGLIECLAEAFGIKYSTMTVVPIEVV